MTSIERGKRIKEARIAKKMTQSEVVGDFITRNMLSQIESGAATPSVKTLEYLAETLDIPISELMPRSDSVERDEETEGTEAFGRLLRAKELLGNGLPRDALAELEGCAGGGLEDEFYAVSARCCLKAAEELSSENTAEAVEYAKKAADLAERGFYANPALKAQAVSLLNDLAERLSRYYAGLISKT